MKQKDENFSQKCSLYHTVEREDETVMLSWVGLCNKPVLSNRLGCLVTAKMSGM